MEHFLEGIAPLRHWYINPNEKSNKYKSSLLLRKLTKALTEHFLQGNVPLRHLLNTKSPFMSWRRSAFNEVNDWALSQFVIHRGLIITTMQAIFSAVFYFSSVSLYQGFLMVGFSTVYTMFPVFSLVLDKDISDKIALTYPELYKDLSKGRSLSYKTFFTWCLISIYQGRY